MAKALVNKGVPIKADNPKDPYIRDTDGINEIVNANTTFGKTLGTADGKIQLKNGNTVLSEVTVPTPDLSDYGKTLAISGQSLSLKNGDTVLSTVTIPGGSGGGDPYKLINYDNTNNYFTYSESRLSNSNISVGDLIYFKAPSSGVTYPIALDSSGTRALKLYGYNKDYGGESSTRRKEIKKLSSWFLARVTNTSSSYVTAYIIACANTVRTTDYNFIDRLGFVVSESSATTTAPKIYAPSGSEVTITTSQYVEYQDGTFAYYITVPSTIGSSGSFHPGRMNNNIFDFIAHTPSSGGNVQFYGYYYDATNERYKTFASEGLGGGADKFILYGHTYN